MQYAVELYFDDAAEQLIRKMWQAMEEAGIPSGMLGEGFRPHVTLAVYEKKRGKRFVAGLEHFATTIKPITLKLDHYGIFATEESVLFLGVTVSSALLRLHRAFQRRFKMLSGGLKDYYLVDRWVPHCTIAHHLPLEQMAAAINVFKEMGVTLPIQPKITAISLIEVSTRNYKELHKFAVRQV
ncbi:MAG: 2'-5' RNA ligase family protein [Anaerolineae bacterium]|nr:2'-5' RNA ligase family protein [Anaerolineae bacterium]